MVILDPSIDERTVAPSLDRFLGVIRNDGGTVDKVDIWGRRRLAYEIDKHSEGIYAVVNLTATSAATKEPDRHPGRAVCGHQGARPAAGPLGGRAAHEGAARRGGHRPCGGGRGDREAPRS